MFSLFVNIPIGNVSHFSYVLEKSENDTKNFTSFNWKLVYDFRLGCGATCSWDLENVSYIMSILTPVCLMRIVLFY